MRGVRIRTYLSQIIPKWDNFVNMRFWDISIKGEIFMANRLWDEKYQTFLAVVKGLRKSSGMTQIELAARLDKPQSYVSKYESGERSLDFVETMEVCEALGVNPEKLIKLYQKSQPDII